jgi:phage-related protein
MGKSIIGALPAIGGYIASMWASVAPTLAATWPILAIIAGVAALAAGVYLLIKNWDGVAGFFSGLWEKVKGAFSAAFDWIKNLFFGVPDWILVAVSFFMPIIGIPALIIKHWDAIKQFFVNLWNDPKAAIEGFIDWIGGKVEAFAPFKAIGDVVGGVFNKVGGFFKGLVGGGQESGTALNDAFASGIQSNASVPGTAFNNSLQGIGRQMPHSDAYEGPLSGLTASGRALTDTFASGMDASVIEQKFSMILPDINQPVNLTGDASLEQSAPLAFPAAMPQRESIEIPVSGEGSSKSAGSQTVHIQNLYVQAEDCETFFDFVRMIMQSANRPQECPA